MRKTALTAAVSALAAAALLAGVGTAAADEVTPGTPVDTVAPGAPEETVDKVDPVDLDEVAECVVIPTYTGLARCMSFEPAVLAAVAGSFGYGSLGTGSLADLLTGILNAASVGLSVDLPIATGSYAPGSTGSYGPEASVGQVLTIPLASLGGAS